jgi:multidrug efflux pump
MSISEPFIRRPIATTLLMIGVFLAGIVAFRELPVSALPQVEYPTIVVSTYLPGASAETMASSVTTPLERQFGQMPSLSQMTSISSFGQSQVTLVFTLERDIDAAEQDVQAAINAASTLLPRTLPAPPTYSKSNPADAPVLTLAIASNTLPLRDVNDVADSILAQKISQVSGVGLVTLAGAQKPAVRVQVDPAALAGAGMSLEDIRNALVLANVNQPKGTLDGTRQDYTVATDDQLGNAKTFRPVVVAYKNGGVVRLGDVADVIDGVENAELAAWAAVRGQGAPPPDTPETRLRTRSLRSAFVDRRAIILNVQRQPGANVIAVADRVKALLPRLRAAVPQGVDVRILSDRTETVRASVHDVEMTLAITIGLVVLVIFAFLRNLRATAIPSVAVPLSLVGTFGVMYLLGYSLNNLSLMALTIATGFVVDDAIVMVENVARFVEEGKPPFEAALIGAKQIGFTIVSLTVSLVAVLIPLLFMTGLIGRLFREFAVTLAVAIVVSALLSLTLTAMMSAHVLRPEPKAEERGRLYRLSERSFEAMISAYDRTLTWVLDHSRTTLAVAFATVLLTVGLALAVPKGFFPQEDTGLITAFTEAAPDVSFPRMMLLQERVSEVVRADPAVATVSSFIGADGTNMTTNTGRLSIVLRPHDERDDDAAAVIARLSKRLHDIEGVDVYLQSVQDLTIDARPSRTPFQYTLEDPDPAELAEWAPRVREALSRAPELRNVTSDLYTAGLGIELTIDRDSAARLGITPQMIDDTLYDAFGQRQITTIFTQLNLYRVILEVKPEMGKDARSLEAIYIRGASGDPVPLSAFVQVRKGTAPLAISHQGQFPSVTISFDTAQGVSLGAAVDAVTRETAKLGTPAGLHGGFGGTAQAFRESLASEPVLILAALVTVYIVLGILYESTIHPITILSTLPSAGVGAFLALIVCRTEFTVIALIGIVLLIGIVKKNAIMMIDFALEAEQKEGLSPRASIHKASLLRFRPIMMTTMAALLGGLPLALGSGTGSELRRPLGITIVGGLLLSQVLTLYTTPVIYLYMERLKRFLLRRTHREAAA